MSINIGTTIGSYKISEKLGKGGMATVYKAYHENLDRDVAIKVLHAVFKDEDSFLRRFSREAKVVAKLEHPHIVPVYDFAEFEGYPYLVMKYIGGETLKEHITSGKMNRAESLRIIEAIAKALDYAHKMGVLHRDIKPSNILLTNDDGVYIADFGLARISQAGESTLSQDMIMGTPQYISPEQAKGVQKIDGRTDIYSFGIVVYEMITGQVPFQSDTSYSIIHSQIFDPPPPPSSINADISPALESVLLKVLSKEPEDRYATAGEFFQDLSMTFTDLPSELNLQAVVSSAATTSIGTPPAVPTPSATPATPPPLPNLMDAPTDQATAVAKPRKRRTGLYIGIGIFIGMLLCGFLILAILSGLDEEAADDPSDPERIVEVELNLPDEVRDIETLEELAEENPDNRPILLELAAAYTRDGRSNDARETIDNVLSNSRRGSGVVALSEQLLSRGSYEMAELVLEEGLDQFPKDQNIQQILLMTYLLNEKSETAVSDYLDQIGQHNPTDTTMGIGQSFIAAQNDDFEVAFDIYESTVENGEYFHYPELLYFGGRLYRSIDETEIAEALLEEALENDPSPWLATLIDVELVQLDS